MRLKGHAVMFNLINSCMRESYCILLSYMVKFAIQGSHYIAISLISVLCMV